MSGRAGAVEEDHAGVVAALGALAAGALEVEDARAVEAHLATCPTCRAEAERLGRAAGWLGSDERAKPPEHLREAVMAAARRRRPVDRQPRPRPERSVAVEAYAAAADELDRLVDGFGPGEGLLLVNGWTVPQLLRHLADADATLAVQLGQPEPERSGLELADADASRAAWRAQADALLRTLGAGGQQDPGWPLEDAVWQRAFETRIHGDDLRVAMGHPPSPPGPAQLAGIVALGVRLLPLALRALGAERPGQAVALRLEGPGGGEWTVPFSPDDPGDRTRPAATLTTGAAEFFYLMGNRRAPGSVAVAVAGDPDLAADLLRATATLGCD